MTNNVGLYSAFLLGMFHALEPGHGKTAIIGYLIGQRGSWLPALSLGLANALTHGTLIFIVALLVLSGMTVIDLNNSEEGLHYFSKFAGVVIIALACWVIYKELKGEEECCEETKVSLKELSQVNSTWKQVKFSFVMGISGGLVPCGSAVAMYLANITDGEYMRGIYSIMLFSLGLLISVTLTTWLIVRSMSWVKVVKKPGFEKKLLWIRFGIMFITGLVLIIH
jgi:nickel/cobalt exporter